MGLWSKIKKAVKKVADAVEDFVNDVGDAVGDAIEAVGDAINDALNWVGEKTGFKAPFSWLGGIIKGVFSVIGAVVKGVFGIVGGIISGVIKIVGGLLTGQWGLMLEGVWDIFSPIVGTIIVVVGKVISLIQSVFYAQGFERPLTDDEKKNLKRVFKKSLNYYVIRIIEKHSGVFGANSRAFTLGNTIYMKSDTFSVDLLVHETTHIWQYQQRGNRYTSDALTAQWFVPDAYSWEREVNVRNKEDWNDFNGEAQAKFVEDLWINGELHDKNGTVLNTGGGCFYDADNKKTFGYFEMNGINYTVIAENAVKTIRNEWV